MNTNDIPKAHPSLLDALHRQDEKARQMNLSERFEERVMTSLPKSPSPRLSIKRIAAIFLFAAFLGGLAWAIVPLLHSRHTAEPPQPTTVSAPSLTGWAGGESGLLSFSNQRLDSILTVVATRYDREVCFRDTTVQALRLSTLWDAEDSLSVFIATLNEFDGLRLADERDTIFVESVAEEEE